MWSSPTLEGEAARNEKRGPRGNYTSQKRSAQLPACSAAKASTSQVAAGLDVTLVVYQPKPVMAAGSPAVVGL